MKKNMVWLVVSCVMVLSLILASCAPAAPPVAEKPAAPAPEKPAATTAEKLAAPVKEEAAKVKLSLTKTDGTVVEKWVEKPRYGGVIREGWSMGPNYFDMVRAYDWGAFTTQLTNEHLFMGDWAKGSAGTGEASWLYMMPPASYLQAGCLAESWELADSTTLVYHIRKGVHWHNKPPVNGRELVADDVAFTLNYYWKTPSCAHCYSYGGTVESITAPDKWTVVIKCQPGKTAVAHEFASFRSLIIPPEVVKKYGGINDWENSCGTGAFILVDYTAV